MWRYARRLLLLAGVSLAISGCLSPTLPLPPPAKPDVEQVEAGQYRISGRIPHPGFVFILNKRLGKGVVAMSDGRYAEVVAALPNDPMQVWYEANEEASDIVEFEIPDGPSPSSLDGGVP